MMDKIEIEANENFAVLSIETARAVVAMINEICIPNGAFDDEQLPIAKQIADEFERAIMAGLTPPPSAPWDDPDWVEPEND